MRVKIFTFWCFYEKMDIPSYHIFYYIDMLAIINLTRCCNSLINWLHSPYSVFKNKGFVLFEISIYFFLLILPQIKPETKSSPNLNLNQTPTQTLTVTLKKAYKY